MPRLRFTGKTINLSSEQYQAIKCTSNSLVLACPGSGKTRLLTCKAVYLLKQEVSSSQRILLITFTKKAAHEMKVRAHQLEPRLNRLLMIGTFHHLAYQILKHTQSLPKDTRIIDAQEQTMGWEIVAGNQHQHMQHQYQQRIFQEAHPLDATEELFIQRYQQWKTENNYIDFSDIILLFLDFLKTPNVFHQAYSHIMVDECQDLNHLQYQILKLMVPHCRSITLVGDLNQSIYGFRHADPQIVYKCQQEFQLKKYYLTKNYRSHPQIVALANQIIPCEMTALVSDEILPEQTIYWCSQEFTFLVDKILEEVSQGVPFYQMMVMARSHWYLNLAATVLRRHNIPTCLKSLPIEQSPAGKKMIAFLRILMHKETHLDTLQWQALQRTTSLQDLSFPDALSRAYTEFSSTEVLQLKQKIADAETPQEAYQRLIAVTDAETSCGVLLSTIHQSKGMEFPVCFLIGAAQQYLPHPKAPPEEEKRLLYVAVTRAIKRIYISCSKEINKKGCLPTRFLSQLTVTDVSTGVNGES